VHAARARPVTRRAGGPRPPEAARLWCLCVCYITHFVVPVRGPVRDRPAAFAHGPAFGYVDHSFCTHMRTEVFTRSVDPAMNNPFGLTRAILLETGRIDGRRWRLARATADSRTVSWAVFLLGTRLGEAVSLEFILRTEVTAIRGFPPP